MRESETRNATPPPRRLAVPAIRRSGDPAAPPDRKRGETGGGGRIGASGVRGEIEPSHAAPSRQTAIEPQRRLAHDNFDQQYADMLSRLPRRDAHEADQIISEFATNG